MKKKLILGLEVLCFVIIAWLIGRIFFGYQPDISDYAWLGAIALIQSAQLVVIDYFKYNEYPQERQVYCTKCIGGDNLFAAISEGSLRNPKRCDECNPWSPEDSTPFSERPNYTRKWR